MGRQSRKYRENLIPISATDQYELPSATIFQKKGNTFVVVAYSCYLCNRPFKGKNTLFSHKKFCKSINTLYDYSKFEIIKRTDNMPIQTLTIKGEKFYRWGDQGKLYRSRADAEKQAQAAYASGYKEKKSTNERK